MNASLKILLMLLFVWNTNSQFSRDDIETSSGPIRGTKIVFRLKPLTQYLGIPFAQPPVGDLRFKKPQPVIKRTGIILANKMPPACIQYMEYPFPWYDFQDGKSEDCLYLNIWVPRSRSSNSQSKLPVMFWVYGGGFTVGSNREPLYNGQALAAEGNVIVVTINYRLAAFGFLTSGTEEAPGNVGMYDMLEALKWVNKNIEAFGGDPRKVTLAGESAGSIAVGLLCVSPLTKGLFHRVIMESASPAYLLAEDNSANIAMSQKLAKAVGCADDNKTIENTPKEVVSCLRNIDALKIAKALSSFNPTSSLSFFPMYGDEILPNNPRKEIIKGNFHNVDVLVGNTMDEGGYSITTGNPDMFGFFGEKNPRINKSYGETIIRSNFNSFPNPDAVVQHYLGDLSENDYSRVRHQVYTSNGDYVILCPTVYFAESYSKAGNNVYYYFFAHRPSTTPWAPWMGVMHFEEIQFVFGMPLQTPRNYTDLENLLSRRMIKVWTDFVKTGKPGKIKWPRYSKDDPKTVILDTKLNMKYGEGPHRNDCDFFRGYFGFE